MSALKKNVPNVINRVFERGRGAKSREGKEAGGMEARGGARARRDVHHARQKTDAREIHKGSREVGSIKTRAVTHA